MRLRRGLVEHLPRLSANGVKIYIYLLLKVRSVGVDQGVYRTTTRQLAEDLDMNRRAVLNALGELEDLAPKPFIEIERASNQHKLTAYRVLRFDLNAGAESAPAQSRPAGLESAPAPTPAPTPADQPKQLAINGFETPKTEENKNTVKSAEFRPAKNGSYPGWFERFWASYPSRKGAKKPAFKQAAKVIKSAADVELAGRYLAIRARHIESMKARGSFIENLPHAERYFSRGLWNQEPEVAVQVGDDFKRSWEA